MPVLSKTEENGIKRSYEPDIGTRMFMTFMVSISCIYLSNTQAMLILVAFSTAYALMYSRFRFLIKGYLLLLIMALMAVLCVKLLFWLLPEMRKSGRGAGNLAVPFLRIWVMANMVIASSSKASVSGMTSFLHKVKLPGIIRLPLMIILRFIPTFFNDMKRLNEAITLRFGRTNGRLFWLKNPFLWTRIYFLPLVVRLIRSGEELAIAAELKGLTPDTEFGREKFEVSLKGVLYLTVTAAVITSAVLLQRIYYNA